MYKTNEGKLSVLEHNLL